MEEYEEGEEEYPTYTVGPRPVRLAWPLPVAIFLESIGGVLEAIAGLFSGLSVALCSHQLYREQQTNVHEQMAREIETLTEG